MWAEQEAKGAACIPRPLLTSSSPTLPVEIGGAEQRQLRNPAHSRALCAEAYQRLGVLRKCFSSYLKQAVLYNCSNEVAKAVIPHTTRSRYIQSISQFSGNKYRNTTFKIGTFHV